MGLRPKPRREDYLGATLLARLRGRALDTRADLDNLPHAMLFLAPVAPAAHRHNGRRVPFWLVAPAVALAAFLVVAPAHAYVGPGAGIAFLTTAGTLLVSAVFSFFLILIWPLRQV